MHDKNIFFTSLSILVLLIIADTFAKLNSFYYFYPNADIIMHLLGGFSITGVGIAALRRMNICNIPNIFILIFLVSVFWEYLEYQMGRNVMINANFWIDTYTDLLMNSVGGIIAYICFYKQKNLQK